MSIKSVESVLGKEVSDMVVRFLITRPLIDKKWVQGLTQYGSFLVVKYPKNADRYLAEWNEKDGKKVQWWDYETHEEIKTAIEGYENFTEEQRKDKDLAKAQKARELLNSIIIERFTSDNFQEVQDVYCEWSGENKLMLGK